MLQKVESCVKDKLMHKNEVILLGKSPAVIAEGKLKKRKSRESPALSRSGETTAY